MSGEALRALAKAGLDAQLIGAFIAGEAAIFTLCLVIVIIVGITTDDENKRQFCHAIVRDLLEFFRDVFTRRGGKK